MTFSDYQNNKLSFKTDCKTEKRRFKLNEFFNQRFITVKYKEEKIKLLKDSIYGILDCDEPLIRFQDKESYTLAEKGPLWIFYKEENVQKNKLIYLEKRYFFCVKGDDKLKELTINNIKQEFPGDTKLHDLIDDRFHNREVSEYDTFHKMFKINRIINDSKSESDCPQLQQSKGKPD